MTERWVALLLLTVSVGAACGDRSATTGREPAPPAVTYDDIPAAQFDSLVMPDLPEARQGYLVARSAGPFNLDGSWPAVAGLCEDPAVLQVLADQSGIGTLLVLQLPATGERLTQYPVTLLAEGAPEPPASQIGVQLFDGDNAYLFQGLDGTVEILGFDARVSGRYAITLREIASDQRAKSAGVFQGVVIENLPPERCQSLKDALAESDTAVRRRPR